MVLWEWSFALHDQWVTLVTHQIDGLKLSTLCIAWQGNVKTVIVFYHALDGIVLNSLAWNLMLKKTL